MPASGPVYQPTTVTYEQQPDWTPASYLSQTVSHGLDRSRCLQWLLLIVGLFVVAAGLIMLVEGAIDFADTHKETNGDEATTSSDVVIAYVGGALVVLGLAMLALYLRLAARRRGKQVCPVFAGVCCPCLASKQRPPLDAANGQMLTVNPSTDLLVSAQYGPVNEIAYQPPAMAEEEETRTLMAADHKDKNQNEEGVRKKLEVDDEEETEAELESIMPDDLSTCSGVIAAINYDEHFGEQIVAPKVEEEEDEEQPQPPPSQRGEAGGGGRHRTGGPRHLKRSASRRRKLKNHHHPETSNPNAPLAQAEELSPSLRSSYASIYLYEDDDDDEENDEDSQEDTRSRRSLPAVLRYL